MRADHSYQCVRRQNIARHRRQAVDYLHGLQPNAAATEAEDLQEAA